MKHFLDWAEETGEGDDTLRAIRRIPARLGMLDADLGSLPDDMIFFEKNIAGVGYSVSTRAKDPHEKGRREDSRIRAALRRYNEITGALAPVDNAVRARYDALIEIIAAEEDLPGSGAAGGARTVTIWGQPSVVAAHGAGLGYGCGHACNPPHPRPPAERLRRWRVGWRRGVRRPDRQRGGRPG